MVTRVPIACTLTADAAIERLAEWETFLATGVQWVETEANSATLILIGGSDVLLAATDLAEREKTCCSFFQFSIELDGIESRLHIEVPSEAEPILSDLLTRLPPNLRLD
jgi:hypothetical protein